MISGILTAIIMIAFFLMVGWAWSSRRTAEFEHMANLPLEDDDGETINKAGEENDHV